MPFGEADDDSCRGGLLSQEGPGLCGRVPYPIDFPLILPPPLSQSPSWFHKLSKDLIRVAMHYEKRRADLVQCQSASRW